MAKHSKGKHGKPKSGGTFPFGRRGVKKAEGVQPEATEFSSGEKGDREPVEKRASHAAHASNKPKDIANESVSECDDVATASNAQAPIDSKQAADEQKLAIDSLYEGATSDADAEEPEAASQPAEGAFMSASDILEGKNTKRKKIAKRIGISTLSVIGVAAAVYFVGVFVFSTHFMPNTHIDDLDLSFKTPEEVQSDFDDKVGDYTIKVKGNGLNIKFTAAQAGMAIDSTGMTKAISAAQDPWKWPVEIFEDRDMTHAMTDSLSASTMSEVVKSAVDEVNAKAVDPVNAYVAYDEQQKAFDIVPEVPGTKLDYEEVLADILVGAMTLKDQVVILDDCLVEPELYEDDKRLVAAKAQANELIKSNLTLMMGGTEAAKVTADNIHGWVSITPEFDAVLDDAAMVQWAADLASQFNTVGSERTFTRSDGKVITVSGGDYGWKVDKDALSSTIAESIKNGTSGNIDIPVLQGGTGYAGVGGRDWGTRYIDVDISEQQARLYGEDGSIIWESAIVSGAPYDGRSTPYGVYDVNLKGKNVTLVGRNSSGEVTYETPVTFWMPFIANSIGFHDATWQSSFGGNRWRQGSGSHGCINLPYGKAEELYGLLQVGDVVVVHS